MFPSLKNIAAARLLASSLLVVVVAVVAPPSAARGAIADTWSWPVAPPWRIERGYVVSPNTYNVGHRGIDLTASDGAAVLAPASGTVIFSGIVVNRGVISIDHGNGVTSSFEPVTAGVVTGERVQPGDVIGVISGIHTWPSGACACLHLGARLNGEYLSPLAFLSSIDRAVLLPWRDERSQP